MITVILVLIVAGFLLWLIERLIPMDETVRIIVRVVVVLLLLVYLLNAFGLINIPLKLK